jgi:eukaryotic-like serine/threonine-protein kinase
VFQRAALGAVGAWWLVLAEVLGARTLHLGPPEGAPAGDSVQGALSIAGDAVGDVVASGLPLLAVLWALAAAVAPWVIRGRSLALDVVAASAWAAGLASATGALATWLGLAEPRGLVAGAVVAGVAAVAGARMGDFAHVDGE